MVHSFLVFIAIIIMAVSENSMDFIIVHRIFTGIADGGKSSSFQNSEGVVY
jgi:hypothetical protein